MRCSVCNAWIDICDECMEDFKIREKIVCQGMNHCHKKCIEIAEVKKDD